MLEGILKDGFSALHISPDAAAYERYRIYFEYLEEMNQVMNLTAISGEEDVARLHFLDCAALLSFAELSGKRVIDIGSGAGFPGLALKIACPDMDITLLDSLDKRIGFLKKLCEKLSLSGVECVHMRAEEAPAEYRQSYDYALSRAVARLSVLAELCMPFVKKGGYFVAMKGPDCKAEVDEAKRAIALLGGELECVENYGVPGTDIVHAAVIVRKVKDSPARYPRRWAQIKKQPL